MQNQLNPFMLENVSIVGKNQDISQPDPKDAKKYTSQFDIIVSNDFGFDMARQIKGVKGCNMRRIIEECNGVGSSSQKGQVESIRLKLKGKGTS